MVDYIDKKSPPPEELELSWQCQKYHALPVAGGILDQPHNLMLNMNVAENAYNAWSEWKRCDPENKGEWIKNNPQLYAICNQILKEQKNG